MASFFKLPKNRRFSYKPRYYNEREELRKEREAAIIKEVEAEKQGKRTKLTKDEMDNYIQLTRRTRKKSNIRLLVILALLLLLAYYMFYN